LANSNEGRNTSGQNRNNRQGRRIKAPGERRFPLAVALVGGGLAAVVIAFIAVVVLDMRSQTAGTAPSGVESFDVPSRDHTDADVDYAQSPPVGGDHNPVWQNCGFYPEPINNETAVHSLEHGAVWITYRPDLPQDQVDRLRELAGQTFVLVSPQEDLPSPVVASAWGEQLQADSAGSPELEQFVGAFRQGPQTLEPGAACTGGVGEPA
jgi:hypothetical protein